MAFTNDFSNVSVVNSAVCDSNGFVDFTVESKDANSHMTCLPFSHAQSLPSKVISVPALSLDSFCFNNSVIPDVIKVDVEGAEMSVLMGSQDILFNSRAHWIISTHSADLEVSCLEFMISCGYEVRTLLGFQHELLCTPPE